MRSGTRSAVRLRATYVATMDCGGHHVGYGFSPDGVNTTSHMQRKTTRTDVARRSQPRSESGLSTSAEWQAAALQSRPLAVSLGEANGPCSRFDRKETKAEGRHNKADRTRSLRHSGQEATQLPTTRANSSMKLRVARTCSDIVVAAAAASSAIVALV